MQLTIIRVCLFMAATLLYATAFAQFPARYNQAGGNDTASAVIVDHAGNLYVVGTVYVNSTNGYDLECVSYDASGNQRWHYEYNGPDSKNDYGTGIVCDWQGHLYCCGVSKDTNGKGHFFVVKLNPADGSFVWPSSGSGGSGNNAYRFYNGAIQLNDNSDDGIDRIDSGYLCAIAIENVAGSQPTFAITGPTKPNGGSYNKWRTVVFETDGSGAVQIKSGWPVDDFQTVNDNDQSYAVAIAPDHTVYVTGGVHSSTTSEAMTTVRYYASGTSYDPLTYWVDRAETLNGKGGKGKSIAVDLSGNAFVTGYRVDGSPVTQYETRKILQGASGDGDLATWHKEYEPSLSENKANSICLSYEVVSGVLTTFAYVTGQSYVYQGSSLDIATIRYAGSDGNPEWSGDGAKRYTGSGYDDAGMQVVSSGNGNAYVIGLTGNGTNDDYVLLGYDKTGSNLFSAVTYNNGGLDRGYALAIGSAGSVFYTGTSADSGQLDFYTDIKSGFGTIDTKVPWSLSYTGGAQPSGSVSDVQSSNDAYYSLHGLVSGNNYLDMVFIFETTINSQSPQEITVTVESHVDKDDHGQKVEAYDYLNSSWVLVADQPATNGTDSSIVVTLPGDPARYIGDSDAAKIRVTTYVYPGYSHGSHYVFFDYVKWDVLH